MVVAITKHTYHAYELPFAMSHGDGALCMLRVAKVKLDYELSPLRGLWRVENGSITLW